MRVDDLGIGQELAVHTIARRRDHVGLVDKGQIEMVQLAGTRENALNTGNYDFV